MTKLNELDPGAAKKIRARNTPKAKAAPKLATPESIKTAVNARTGNGLVITTTKDRSIVVQHPDGQVNKLALVGLPVKPLEEYLASRPKPRAQMARGTDSHTAPHSAKAVQDQKRAEKATKPTAKASKAKAPARGTERDYTRGKTAIAAKPDSWRHHMLTVITKHDNTAKAKAAHAKSGKFSANKLDFNWAAAQGYITWAK